MSVSKPNAPAVMSRDSGSGTDPFALMGFHLEEKVKKGKGGWKLQITAAEEQILKV